MSTAEAKPPTEATPAEVRAAVRDATWTGPTAGACPGHLQANLAILPHELAFEFLLFCLRNPKPCPLVAVTEPGNPQVDAGDERADLRTDLPRYRVWRHGELIAEPADLSAHWREDAVGFLLGCSHTFDDALTATGVPVRHLDAGASPAVYVTTVDCTPAGPFRGPLVVSMRPVPGELVERATEVTGRYPLGHGSPVHIGDPSALGIRDLSTPDFGDPPEPRPGDVPVFWACGVTPQLVIPAAGPAYAMTHYIGHMFVFDHPSDVRLS